jgi:hypothetical protein
MPTEPQDEVTNESLIKAGLDPVKVTPEQKRRLQGIELAIGVLNEAECPFVLFASPDAAGAEMKIMQGNKLSYAKDLATITTEASQARQVIFWAAMKSLSTGLNGAICIIDKDGTPIVMYDNGKATKIEEEKEEVKA